MSPPLPQASAYDPDSDIAIVGMACRVPGADNPEDFWHNLRGGVESVTRIVDPRTGALLRAGGRVEGLEDFDARFFGLGKRDADLLDPAQRMFFENCWTALEAAGYAHRTAELPIGVFGGTGHSTYLMNNVWPSMADERDRTIVDSAADMRALIACDKDFLTGRIAYLLDLRGPAMTVQAACASGLFAVHLACQALLAGECALALAGAANATVPQTGLPGLEDGTYVSRDGYTRTFDAGATGAVFGSGAGVVALKLLADALADGDDIRAVIKGSAVNNDGQHKTGLTAPSVRAQQAVIEEALQVAGVEPADLGMVEAHGTATPIGDPVEVDALNRALRGAPSGSITLTAVKPNIGHLGWAAGIIGLIKAVLCLEHREIPPLVHYTQPNPEIDFASGPLTVAAAPRSWADPGHPRRAGVSAFGVTGFNAHVIVQEAGAPPAAPPPSRPVQIVTVSARTGAAVESAAGRWAEAAATAAGTVNGHNGTVSGSRDASASDGDGGSVTLADLAYTSTVRRPHLPLRRAVAGRGGDEVATALRARTGEVPPRPPATGPAIAQLFTGYVPALRGLAAPLTAAPAFQDVLTRAREPLRAEAGVSLDDILLAPGAGGTDDGTGDDAAGALVARHATQFVLQVALYELWRSWGVRPAVVLGHSLGEFAAACAARVFDLETGLFLVATRARLYEKLPTDGVMAVLHASADEVAEHCAGQPEGTVAIAAINGPANVVVTGPERFVRPVCDAVASTGRRVKMLNFGRAGHSPQVDAVLDEFGQALAQVRLRAPEIPFVSNLTGDAVTDEVTRAEYWQAQLRQPVRFADGLARTRRQQVTGYLEIGPAPVLSGLVYGAYPDFDGPVTGSLRADHDSWMQLLGGLCELYEHGVDVDWEALAASGGGRAVTAPTYGFDRQRHWIPSPRGDQDKPPPPPGAELLYQEAWRPAGVIEDGPPSLPGRHYLVVPDRGDVADRLVRALADTGSLCTVVAPDPDPRRWDRAYRVVDGADRAAVRDAITSSDLPYSGVVVGTGLDLTLDGLEPGLLEIVAVLQGLTDADQTLPCWMLTRSAQWVAADFGGNPPGGDPAPAAVWGLARSAALENPDQEICCIDLDHTDTGGGKHDDISMIFDGLTREDEAEVAYRDRQRYHRRLIRLAHPEPPAVALDPDATYLITGGLGSLGLLTATTLIDRGAQNLVLTSRNAPTPDAQARVDALAERARVSVHLADVSDPGHVAALLAAVTSGGGWIGGVVHCAGVIDDATLVNLDAAKMRTVFAGKARGAWNLHHALGDDPRLRFFTCFSSAASVVGNPGQANYAAANAYVDALMSLRAARGLPGLSLAWGAWADIGHLAENPALMAALHGRGMNPLPHDDAAAVLARLVPAATGVIGVVAYDWARWCADLGARTAATYLELRTEPEQPTAGPPPDPTDHPDLAGVPDLAGLAGAEFDATVRAEVLGAVAEALGLTAADAGSAGGSLELSASLVELGLDSFSAIQFRSRLKRRLGVSVSLSRLVTMDSLREVVDAVAESAAASHGR